MLHLIVLIPAYNEAQTVGKVIATLPDKLAGVDHIDVVVIDDGSTDATMIEAKQKGAKVIRHVLNRGLGAALGTGFQYALNCQCDMVITFDADGQHHPKDLTRLLEPLISKKADVVIGSRLLGGEAMPPLRKMINIFSNMVTWLLFGVSTTDSQSGLRAFSKEALKKMHIRSEKMEVSSEIFHEIGRLKLRKIEVPIRSIYTEYSLAKGQRLTNAPHVLWKLFLQRFS